jgi:transposase-like protein
VQLHRIPSAPATLHYASLRYWDQLAKGLRGTYTAPTLRPHCAAFEELEEK